MLSYIRVPDLSGGDSLASPLLLIFRLLISDEGMIFYSYNILNYSLQKPKSVSRSRPMDSAANQAFDVGGVVCFGLFRFFCLLLLPLYLLRWYVMLIQILLSPSLTAGHGRRELELSTTNEHLATIGL